MLLIYEKATGHIVGTNSSPAATLANMYPDVSEDFKAMYDGIVVDHQLDYDRNRKWYKVENGEAIKLDSPWVKEQVIIPDQKDKRIADLESTVAYLLGKSADTVKTPAEIVQEFSTNLSSKTEEVTI